MCSLSPDTWFLLISYVKRTALTGWETELILLVFCSLNVHSM